MEPIAHSANTAGQTHGLKDHLNAVASLASEFAAKWGAGDLGYWAGLWHDIGKLHPEFQGYLNDPGGRHRGPDHKSAGVLLAMKHMEPLAPILHGHHHGLMSRADLKAWVQEKAAMPQPLIR